MLKQISIPKLYFLFAFTCLFSFANAQEIYPKETSFFGQLGFSHPIERTKNTESGTFNVFFKPGFSAALGVSKTKKSVSSAQLKYTYTNGKFYGKEVYKVGSVKTITPFYFGRVSFEFSKAWFLSEKRNLSFGVGILAGTCAYKNIPGTRTGPNTSRLQYNQYGAFYGDTTETVGDDYFSSKHFGFSLNLNYNLQNKISKLPISVGLKTSAIYGMIPYLNKYLDCELLFSYKFSQKTKTAEKPEEPKEPVNWNKQNGGN